MGRNYVFIEFLALVLVIAAIVALVQTANQGDPYATVTSFSMSYTGRSRAGNYRFDIVHQDNGQVLFSAWCTFDGVILEDITLDKVPVGEETWQEFSLLAEEQKLQEARGKSGGFSWLAPLSGVLVNQESSQTMSIKLSDGKSREIDPPKETWDILREFFMLLTTTIQTSR